MRAQMELLAAGSEIVAATDADDAGGSWLTSFERALMRRPGQRPRSGV